MTTTVNSGKASETDFFFVREGFAEPLPCEPVIRDMLLIERLGQPSYGTELDTKIGVEEVELDKTTCSMIASNLGKNAMRLIGQLQSREAVKALFESIKWFNRIKDAEEVVKVVELPVE